MPSTPTWGLPYPAGTDIPDVPSDMAALANATEDMGNDLEALISLRAGGAYRGTSISIPTTATKLSFGTTVTAASGITWNGTNQFTVTNTGIYSFTVVATMNFVSTSNWAVGIHDASGWPASAYQAFGGMLFATGQTNSFSSGTMLFTAGQTICAYAYNNEATTRTLVGADFRVWRVSP